LPYINLTIIAIMAISKAEQKRTQDTKRILTSNLELKLGDFKNKFLFDYNAFKFKRKQNSIDRIKEDKREFIDGWKKADIIARLELYFERDSLNTLENFIEARDLYNKRLAALVDKLIGFGLTGHSFKIEFIRRDFSLIITSRLNGDTVHARVIYAEGEINAPHYRFITTKRKA